MRRTDRHFKHEISQSPDRCRVSVIATGVLLFVVTDWLFALGASFTGLTVTFTTPVAHCGSGEPFVLPLSQTWYSKLAAPLKFASGV